MRYVDVLWHHSNSEDPVRLVSELDDEGWEVRKLEFFANGQVGYASVNGRELDTRLGEAPVPPLEEINADSQFEGTEIGVEAFEVLWREHVRHAT